MLQEVAYASRELLPLTLLNKCCRNRDTQGYDNCRNMSTCSSYTWNTGRRGHVSSGRQRRGWMLAWHLLLVANSSLLLLLLLFLLFVIFVRITSTNASVNVAIRNA